MQDLRQFMEITFHSSETLLCFSAYVLFISLILFLTALCA